MRQNTSLSLLLSLTAVLLLFFAQSLRAAENDRRIALVIGNSEYDHVSSLPNPANDSKDISEALTRIGFDVVSETNLDYRRMRLILRDFAEKAEDADMALIYFAGHGIEIDNTNYLIPVNAELRSDRDVEFEAIRLDTVIGAMAVSGGLKVILIDACRNNPFLASMTRTSATRSIGRGLGRVDPGGVLVGYAARGGTLALDGDGRNSPYARALLTHLEEPGLELGKMFRKVRDTVFNLTDGHQEPFTYGSLPGEDIFLVPKLQVAALAPKPAALSVGQEIAVGFSVADEAGTIAAWDTFIELFGAHESHPLVRLAMRKHGDLSEQKPRAAAVPQMSDVEKSASAIQDELTAYASAEKLATPRGWALYFDRFPTDRLARSAIVREEQAFVDDLRARVYGRYRTIRDGETVNSEMRKHGLEMLDLPEKLVFKIQWALKSRGNDIGRIDGQIGPRTIGALSQVQFARDLPRTGLPTRATLAALGQIDENNPASGLFSTSGAMARNFDPEAIKVLEGDARLDRVMRAFKGKPLVYGFFQGRLYVAVDLGTTIGEPTLDAYLSAVDGALVEIDTIEEEAFIFDMVRFDQKLWTFGTSNFKKDYGPAIGLVKDAQGWQWRSGKDLALERWVSGQPSAMGSEATYGMLVPLGVLSRNAHRVDQAGWMPSPSISRQLILEIK